MMNGALDSIDLFFQTDPIEAAFMTCAFKAACSDTVSQKLLEKQPTFSVCVHWIHS